MRWFKLVFTVIILGLIALFVYQNLPVFAQNVSFKYDLRYLGNVEWKNSLCSLIAISAGFGFLVGILLMTKPLMGARRRAKEARQAAAASTASVASREPAAVHAASEPAKQGE
ncbi:MAG TPA: lipopolysaccharide assembly protein LapA domain-containing protein [Syntrophobacter fumaroxidans]|nr:lipopolysaccharide assembly protein LapA domain-containing protein [Syntrophobacter fumaroxidans]